MILGTSRAVRVFAYPAPCDLRKGYNGLYGLVQNGLGRDPRGGELFLFVNQSRKLCKVLVWDGTGPRALGEARGAAVAAAANRAGARAGEPGCCVARPETGLVADRLAVGGLA
jgi:transposase